MLKPGSCAVLLALLAGCSYPHGPGTTDLVDGNYRGRPAVTASAPDLCPGNHYGYFELGDRELHFAYMPNIIFDAPVQPDGTIHDVSGPAVLDGKVVDDHMIFSVSTPECQSSYNLRFFLNHS